MAEKLAAASESEQHQLVLLGARRCLVGLRYESTSEEEKTRLEAQLDILVEKHSWLLKPEERFVRRGEYRTVTPLSLLREQLERQYGQEED